MPPYQPLRTSRGFTRVEFLRTLRAVTGREIKLRTLRAWESGQNPAPSWFVASLARVLNLTVDEEVAMLRALTPAGTPHAP